MMKSLTAICEDRQIEIREEYELGHGDAEELFKMLWQAMTAGPNSKRLQDAINLIDETFNI